MFVIRKPKSGYVLGLLAALLIVAVQACNDEMPTSPDAASATPSQAASSVRLGDVLTTVDGCIQASSVVAVDIGPGGGSISLCGNTLVVPAHSLGSLTHIVMLPVIGHPGAVQFFPEGLQFAPNAQPTLTLNTDAVGNPSNAYIVYTDDQGNVREVESTTGRTAHSVSAQIGHFSRYAVAW